MVRAGVGVGAGAILSKETGAGICLVMGGILSNEIEDGVGTDAEQGWVLVVAVGVEEGYLSGALTRKGGDFFKSIGLEVSVGLERAADTEPEVVGDWGTVITLEGGTGAEKEGLVVTAEGGDTITGGLDSPAAELREGL